MDRDRIGTALRCLRAYNGHGLSKKERGTPGGLTTCIDPYSSAFHIILTQLLNDNVVNQSGIN